MKCLKLMIGNKLVIDDEGYAHVLPMFNHKKFPVMQENWEPRNNYVGKYSNLDDLNRAYNYAIYGWFLYLSTKKSQYVTYCNESKIKEYQNKILEIMQSK